APAAPGSMQPPSAARMSERGSTERETLRLKRGGVDWAAWAELPALDLLPRLVNDLEPAAFAVRPELAQMRDALEQSLSRPVRMSGSGSSLFTLYDTEAEAARASAEAREK